MYILRLIRNLRVKILKKEGKKMVTNSGNEYKTVKFSLPGEIKSLLDSLSSNPKITFKSQQRNDPELLPGEKFKMALEIYERNPQTFLLRFGNYLEERHLKDFAQLSVAKGDEEMQKMIEFYQSRLINRKQEVKNRRFVALQKLIDDGDYFSEQEMMKRSPELYQELVGQYLSSEEKKQRDCYDVRNTTFSGILMYTIEQQEICNIMNAIKENITQENNKYILPKIQNTENKIVDDTMHDAINGNLFISEEESGIPINCKNQWGNFDNESIPCSSFKHCINKNLPLPLHRNNVISAEDKDLLKQEFIGIMHEQFLAGRDIDFDYTTVDESTQYDDLQQINRDKEEQYFNESDNDKDSDIESGQLANDKEDIHSSESEDELDIYMRHLRNQFTSAGMNSDF